MEDGVLKLKNLIRNVSRSRLTQQGLAEEVQIKEIPAQPLVYSHWMAIILVSGPAATITFKTHFKTHNARLLAAPMYGVPPEKVAPAQAIDSVREFCNLTAGGLKRSLFNIMDLHLSLPVITRGFDEIYFPRIEGKAAINDRWRLAYRDNELFCTVSIDMKETVDFSQLDENAEAGVENTTEIEYL